MGFSVNVNEKVIFKVISLYIIQRLFILVVLIRDRVYIVYISQEQTY